MRRCPECGGTTGAAKKNRTTIIDDTTFVVKVAAFVCGACKAVFTAGATLELMDFEIASVLASRAPPTGAAFRFMRKTLRMRAQDLAVLLGVTAETISRWENDQRPLDGNAWIVVGSMALEKTGRPASTLRRLINVRKTPSSLRKTVRIDLSATTITVAATPELVVLSSAKGPPSSSAARRATGT